MIRVAFQADGLGNRAIRHYIMHMTAEIVLISLGVVFAAGAVIALLLFSAVCPDLLWNLPPERQTPPQAPRARRRSRVSEVIDLVEWRPSHWR